MKRIDAPFHVGNRFADGNPQTGQRGTRVPASFLNGVQEEIIGVIEDAGLPADETLRLSEAVRKLAGQVYPTLADAEANAGEGPVTVLGYAAAGDGGGFRGVAEAAANADNPDGGRIRVTERPEFATLEALLALALPAEAFGRGEVAKAGGRRYEIEPAAMPAVLSRTSAGVRVNPERARDIDIREAMPALYHEHGRAAENSTGIEQVIAYLASVGGGTIEIPECTGASPNEEGGHIPFARRIMPDSHIDAPLTIRGKGPRSYLRNITTDGSRGGEEAMFCFGNYAPSGQYDVDEDGNLVNFRNMFGGERYAVTSFEGGSEFVELANPADAEKITDRMMIRMYSTAIYGEGTRSSAQSPYQDLNFVEWKAGSTIKLRYPTYKGRGDIVIGRGDGSDTGLVDYDGVSVQRMISGLIIENIGVGVANYLQQGWHQRGSMVGCLFKDIFIHQSRAGFLGNGVAHSEFNGLRGFAAEGLNNFAYFSSNAVMHNMHMAIGALGVDPPGPYPLFHAEENAHDIHYHSFSALCGPTAVTDLFKINKAGENIRINNFRIVANGQVDRGIFLAFTDDSNLPRDNYYIGGGKIVSRNIGTPVRVAIDAGRGGADLRAVIADIDWDNGASIPDDANRNLALIEGTGVTLEDLRFRRGNRIVYEDRPDIRHGKLRNVSSGEEVTVVNPRNVPLDISGLAGPKSAPFKAAARTGYGNTTSTVAEVLETATFPLVRIGDADVSCLQRDDRIEISFQAQAVGNTGEKELILSINGDDLSVSLPVATTGLLAIDLAITVRPTFVSAIHGTLTANGVVTPIAQNIALATDAANEIRLLARVGASGSTLNTTWSIKPLRRHLNA